MPVTPNYYYRTSQNPPQAQYTEVAGRKKQMDVVGFPCVNPTYADRRSHLALIVGFDEFFTGNANLCTDGS